MKKLSIILLGMAAYLGAVECPAATITVNWDGAGDFATIQAAIDAANDLDNIIVAEGTYTENIKFNGKNIILRSTDPDDWSVVERTIIDGGGLAFVVKFDGTESSDCKLAGFTITGGNIPGGGGGIRGLWTEATVANCIVKNNTAGKHGGGIYNINGCIDSCIIYGNTAVMGGGGIAYSDGRIVNCLVYGNRGGPGSGMFECNGDIVNCTVVKNSSSRDEYSGGIIGCKGTITNCLVWGNEGKQVGTRHQSIITYCCIQDWVYGGLGNIATDPQFVDAAWGVYYLQLESGCIDAGTNEPPGGLPAVDIDGNLRPIDGDDDGVAVTNIGAYEAFASEEPVIGVSARDFEFVVYEGEARPADKILGIRNSGPGTINWELSYDCDWLEVIPISGSSTTGQVNEVTLSVDTTGLVIGEYNCTLTITAAGAVNSPQTIEVNLRVTEPLSVPAEYETIQEAINEAADGDTVLVADGTYTGKGNYNIDFRGKAITVRSENGPADCIIDCENSGCGFYFHNRERADSIIDGFTITGGSDGGIICGHRYENYEASSPTITNCIISGNKADHYYRASGGGITCWGGSSPSISNCIIENNRSIEEAYGGGGIYCEQANVTVITCIIRNNTVDGYWANSGGGIYSVNSTLLIINSVIADNSCPGLYGRHEYSSNGGGIFCANSDVTIVNSTIAGNSTVDMGGGIYSNYSEVTLKNCIAWGNSANLGTNLAVGTNNLWRPFDSYSQSSPYYESIMSISYSDIEGGQSEVYIGNNGEDIIYWGEGNIDIDPAFIGRGNGDHHLLPWSPCIDAGDNTAVPGDILTDLDGYLRFFDDPNMLDTGQGAPPIVDMGAYEFNPQAAISISPEVMEFSVYVGQPEPVSSSFQISNLGRETLNWSMNSICDWIMVDKLSGSLSVGFDVVRLNIDITSLPVGTNQCRLIITSPEAINSPQTLTVIVNVSEPLRVPELGTIQSAINLADDGDFVVVADGVYTGQGNTNVSFKGKAITVRSRNGPDNCIIDCQGLTGGFKFVSNESFVPVSNEGARSVLSGFTIINGLEPYGGGVRVGNYSSPLISNCVIRDCTAGIDGGGIYCDNGSSATIQGCRIINNTSGNSGGGIYARFGTLDIQDCSIANNTAEKFTGGGMFLYENSQINITNCSVEDNISAGGGGGIKVKNCTKATFTNCLLRNNTAGARGGGMRLSGYSNYSESVFSIVNCTFVDNHAEEGGGLNGDNTAVFNSIFVNNNNSAVDGNCTVNYCHFHDNPDGDYWYMTGADVINAIEGNSNNLDGNPMLSSDLHLLPGSPCIDAGDNTALGSGIVTDLDERPRFYDDPNTIDTGYPPGADSIVDIGAYEFTHLPWISSTIWVGVSPGTPISAYQGQLDPVNEKLEIKNIGQDSLSFQISEDCDWLSVKPDSGSISGHAKKTISLTVDASELEVGNYYFTLTIFSQEALNSPVLVDITLRVVEPLTVPAQFATIQAAVDAAGYRDIILVADGTYTGQGNTNVSFKGKAITVRSRNGPDNCIIDCQGLARGFKFISNEGPESVLNGFTIINGLKPYGGGVRVGNYSSPRISNCVIRDCTAGIDGGGIYSNEASLVVINDCDIINNSAYNRGGGIYAMFGTLDIRDCRIVNNTAENSNGGGMFLYENSQINITNCSVEDNISAGGGGGIKVKNCIKATFTNCLLRNNTAGARGGGMRLSGYSNYSESVFSIVNCTFVDNHAEEGGGLNGDNTAVFNSIFVNNNNSAVDGNCTVNYCHFHDNPDGDYWYMTGADVINAIEGNSNNLDGNPMLSSDLHLLPGSPCIDSGTNIPDGDLPSKDLNGNPRIINGIVDMGAYEALLPVEADVYIIPRVINRRSRLKRVIAIMRLPEGIGKHDVADEPFEMYVDEVEGEPIGAIWQRVIGWGRRVSGFALFDKAELMDAVSKNGRIELTVIGKLESGQYIHGSDNVTIGQP